MKERISEFEHAQLVAEQSMLSEFKADDQDEVSYQLGVMRRARNNSSRRLPLEVRYQLAYQAAQIGESTSMKEVQKPRSEVGLRLTPFRRQGGVAFPGNRNA